MSIRFLLGCLTICLAACMLLAGCSGSAEDSLPRQPVWGKVTLDDKPLKQGAISFAPDNPQRAEAVTTGAMIAEGGYSIPKADGPTPGKYRVSILGSDESAPPPSTEPPGPLKTSPKKKPLVPEKYNAKTTLIVEVKEGESNTFDFALKGQ